MLTAEARRSRREHGEKQEGEKAGMSGHMLTAEARRSRRERGEKQEGERLG
jgi:hypothetical protein